MADPRVHHDDKVDQEGRAARLVAELLADVDVKGIDRNQGVQLRDFDIIFPDGRREPLEVTSATLFSVEGARAAHAKRFATWVMKAARGLEYNWTLMPSDRVRFRRVDRPTLVPALRDLELAGKKRWHADKDAGDYPALADMGFYVASRWAYVPPNCLPEVTIGPPSDDSRWDKSPQDPGRHVIDAVELHAGRPDNQSKLSIVTDVDRHLFVWITEANILPWRDMLYNRPPVRPPTLPQAVTSLWVATSIRGCEIVWRWHQARGWSTDLVTSTPEPSEAGQTEL